MDTIFACASARGKAGIAVVRISGAKAYDAVAELTEDVAPRKASLRRLSFDEEHLDDAIVLWFPGPHSFTGEDVVELHLHGSQATVAAVLRVLSGFDDMRIAEPGEFTRRALENEKLDLAQIEGLSDLVEAETEAQRKQALRVLSGALGERAQAWRQQLIRAAALVEATIDFADEEVPVDVSPEVTSLLAATLEDLRQEAAGGRAAERIRDGFEVAIVGPPNVGKSTLLNSLAGRDAAITSEYAGTTRDVIEVRLDLDGLAVTLLDTAGIREAGDTVEAIGIERARNRASQADLRIVLLSDRSDTPSIEVREGDLVLVPKSDVQDGDFSAITGEGIDKIVSRVGRVLSGRASSAGLLLRERHRVAVGDAIRALEAAQSGLEREELSEITAEDLRTAVRKLDSLTGHVDVEHLLDEIFSSFCIGK